MKKQIKKEIIINAPLETVWDYLIDRDKIAAWLMENNFEPKVGREFTFYCQGNDKEIGEGFIYCEVKEIVPFKKIVYSWTSGQLEIETLVTITLKKVNDKTRVTLIHSGWDQLPPDKDYLFDNYDSGWEGYIMQKLKEALEDGNAARI